MRIDACLYAEWIPQMETVMLDGAGHALQMEQPEALAAELAAFFVRTAVGGS